MSDLALVANRKKSVLIVKTGVVAEKMTEWKKHFGSVQPIVDIASTSQVELLNAMKEAGCLFYLYEKLYYDIVAQSIDKKGLEICDFSSNVTEEYLRELADTPVNCVVATSSDDLLHYQTLDSHLQIAVRLSLSRAISDSGITAEEAPALFSLAKSKGIAIRTLCIDCPEAASVQPALEMLQAVKSIAESHGIAITRFVLLNEGVQKLLKSQDRAAAEAALTALTALAASVQVVADASRFFTEDAYTIYTPITGKKVKTSAEETRMLYYVDNGVYCCFYSAHVNGEFPEFVPIHVVSEPSATLFKTTLFGPTCDSIDTLGNDYMLPELKIGDWLKSEHSGYKCSNDSARFNGFEDPDVVVM